jgi:hypothetical protein
MIPGGGYGYGRALASHGYGYGTYVKVQVWSEGGGGDDSIYAHKHLRHENIKYYWDKREWVGWDNSKTNKGWNSKWRKKKKLE